MKWRVLVSAPYFQRVAHRFEGVFAENNIEVVIPEIKERMNEEQLLGIIADIDGVIGGDDQFTERVFKKAQKLKVISKWGTGIDSIDQKAASQMGIAVRNTPNAFTQPVSDSVLGYMLCFARRLPWMDQDIRRGIWDKRQGISLHETTLGVIGVGNVGRAVVRKARGFGMRIMGNDVIELPAEFVNETGIEAVSKERLLREADFVSLNCTLNEMSFHIINEEALTLMKPTAYLINTARGPLIDEQALVKALQGGRIAGAALDVFEKEPLPEDSPLRHIQSCMLAPHNSNSSPEAWERVHLSTLKNLLDELGKFR